MSGEGQAFPNTPYPCTFNSPAEDRIPDLSLSCQSGRPSRFGLSSGIEEEKDQRGFQFKTEIYFSQVTSHQPNWQTQCYEEKQREKLFRMLVIVWTRARGRTRQHGMLDNYRQTPKPQRRKKDNLIAKFNTALVQNVS